MQKVRIEEILEALVKILGPNKKEVSGTGFVIKEDGHIVTCHHVIFNLNKIIVDHLWQEYEAQWCEDYSDPEVDIAILK